jgi:ABC-type nitrate/sulfonate/bicarbonate transport system substrate-binding protein
VPALANQPAVKVVGANGTISLGKQYAGRQVLLEEQEPGVWLVRTATVIPDNERWLQHPQTAESLREALAWAQSHPASDADGEALLKRLRDGGR